MGLIFRSLMYLAAFMIPVVLISTLGLVTSVRTSIPRPADQRAAELVPPPPPAYDASKPTVAVVLGEQEHEITDVIGPYAMFAETGLYNVYMVAQTREPRAMAPRTGYALTGAIDLLPHVTFGELDTLLGRRPDIVVVPQMNGVDAPENRPLLDYIRKQAQEGALTFSWCTGANVLAAAGLLDGRPATAHWGDIDRLLVPGSPSAAQTDASLVAVEGQIAAPIVHLHDPAQPRPAFEAPLEDLARQANVPTAAFANKRLEYRADSLQLVGSGWPILLILQPVLIGGASVGLVWWLTRRRDQRRGRRIPHAQAA